MRLLLVVWMVAGCAASRAQPAPEPIVAGHSREGRPIEVRVLGDGMRSVLILATIHGNEPAGTPLLRRLAENLATRPDLLEGRRVILVPVANPDGYARGTRRNAKGVDINRNFKTANSRGGAPLSEPESRALVGLLERYRPAVVVTIHQPLNCVDYDGPAGDLAKAMAAAGGLSVRKLGAKPGSLGSYVGLELGLPIVTVELPRGASRLTNDELWRRYGDMLLVAVRHRCRTLRPQASATEGLATSSR
ncbi:MAG: M14 family zinc carboxypeptidase [Planctomycetota bacterium]